MPGAPTSLAHEVRGEHREQDVEEVPGEEERGHREDEPAELLAQRLELRSGLQCEVSVLGLRASVVAHGSPPGSVSGRCCPDRTPSVAARRGPWASARAGAAASGWRRRCAAGHGAPNGARRTTNGAPAAAPCRRHPGMMGACAHFGRSRQVPVSSSSTSPSRRAATRTSRSGCCGPGCAAPTCTCEQWDEWAAATVQVPMTLGHEFFGEVVEVGRRRRPRVASATGCSGEGHIVCGNCRNCRAGRRHLCINTVGRRGQPRRGLRRLRRHPRDQRLGAARRPRPRPRARSSTRSATPRTPRCSGRWSARTCSSPGPARSGSWRRRSRGTPGAPDLRHRPVARAAGPGEGGGGRPRRRRLGRRLACATPRRELGMVEGFDIGLGDVRVAAWRSRRCSPT